MRDQSAQAKVLMRPKARSKKLQKVRNSSTRQECWNEDCKSTDKKTRQDIR